MDKEDIERYAIICKEFYEKQKADKIKLADEWLIKAINKVSASLKEEQEMKK